MLSTSGKVMLVSLSLTALVAQAEVVSFRGGGRTALGSHGNASVRLSVTARPLGFGRAVARAAYSYNWSYSPYYYGYPSYSYPYYSGYYGYPGYNSYYPSYYGGYYPYYSYYPYSYGGYNGYYYPTAYSGYYPYYGYYR